MNTKGLNTRVWTETMQGSLYCLKCNTPCLLESLISIPEEIHMNSNSTTTVTRSLTQSEFNEFNRIGHIFTAALLIRSFISSEKYSASSFDDLSAKEILNKYNPTVRLRTPNFNLVKPNPDFNSRCGAVRYTFEVDKFVLLINIESILLALKAEKFDMKSMADDFLKDIEESASFWARHVLAMVYSEDT